MDLSTSVQRTNGPILKLIEKVQVELENDRHVPTLMRCLLECLQTNNSVQKLSLVKQIGLSLQKSCSVTTHQMTLCLEVLVQLYMKTESSQVMKRVIASTLQAFPQSYHKQVVENLDSYLRQEISRSLEENFNDAAARRHLIDNITSCLDNFHLGIQCISEMDVIVLKFLHQSLETFAERLQTHHCPADVQKACLDCQATVRALLALLHREEQGSVEPPLSTHQFLSPLIDVLVRLLVAENNSLDCRCNVGMALILLIRLYTDQGFMRWLFSLIFSKTVLHDVELNENGSLLSQTSFKVLSELTSTSTLCIVLGLLSTLEMDYLSMDVDNASRDILFFDVLFPCIIATTKEVREASLTVITSRATLMWTKRAKEALQETPNNPSLLNNLQADGEICCQLLEYVWTHWEHFIDSVRHGTKDIFDNIITIHILTSKDARNSPFIEWLFSSLMKMPWHNRGKYGSLCCLVRHFGNQRITQLQPDLPEKLLKTMTESAMYSYVNELYETLFTAHKNELRSLRETDADWNSKWIMPVIKSFNSQFCTTHLEHILAKLLKCSPYSLNFIVDEIVATNSESISDNHLRALLATAKTARNLGLVYNSNEKDPVESATTWNRLLPINLLQRALCHIDDEIRLDVFTLLCDSPRTTEVVNEKDFNLIMDYLQFNMTNQSPKFRQKTLAQIKKLILRIFDSGQNLKRQLHLIEQKDPSTEAKQQVLRHVSNYQHFLKRLTEAQLNHLFIGANFPRRGIALGILKLLHEIIGFKTRDDFGSNLQIFLTPQNIQTLLECLKDTYEANKKIVLDILKDLDSSQLAFDDDIRVSELFETALQLSSSCRPQDSLTASYILRLLVNHHATFFIAASLKGLYYDEENETDRSSLPNEEIKTNNPYVFTDTVFSVLEVLLSQLKVELSIAKESLLEASANGPMHGVLLCIRNLIIDLDFRDLLATQEKWQSYLSEIVNICLDICNVVKPIVNNASPEGFFPSEANPELLQIQTQLQNLFKNCATDNESSQITKPSPRAKSVTSQMILLCGWRAMKEVSLLLGDICQRSIEIITVRPRTPDSPDSPRLLMVDQIILVGNFFITLLAETIHRGAFEQAYMGFKKLCDGLAKSPILALYRLPDQWLTDLFEHIQAGTKGTSLLCNTRRSAGIPFMVQALVSSGADSQHSNCFTNAMTTLLEIGLNSVNCEENSKVHAFNILRVLYRDTRLGDDVTPFVSEGLQAAILGFKAKSWTVRNSATLLFSSLMTRIFGVKRSKDELSKKNCMTGNVFFQRYPSLYQFLLNELMDANDAFNKSSNLVFPSLYPVLMILARLYPSSVEGTQTSLKLSSFVPYVITCSRSPIYKTRVLAAKALFPLIPLEDLLKVVGQLFDRLPNSPDELYKHNTVHGVLLQICHVLDELPTVHFSIVERMSLNELIETEIIKKQWLCSNQNKCPITKIAFLQLINNVLCSTVVENDFLNKIEIMKVHNELLNKRPPIWMPGYETLLVEIAKTYLCQQLLKCNLTNGSSNSICQLEKCLIQILNHWSYEVRFAVIRFLYAVMDNTQSAHQTQDYLHNLSDFGEVQNASVSTPMKEWTISIQCKPWITVVIESKQLIRCLLNKLSTEEHPSCLSQLCYFLPTIPDIFNYEWQINQGSAVKRTASEKLEYLLQKGECEKRDDVRCALLHFLSFLITNIYEELKQTARMPRRASVCENVSPPTDPRLVMNELTEAFYICCAPEQSIRLRLTATQLLVRNSYNLLMDPHNYLGPNGASIWSAAVLLLQDDEPYIRYSAAKLINVFSEHNECSLQPEIALDILLKQFVKKFECQDPSMCATMLLDWMLRQESNQRVEISLEDEDRMFDRGQMNIYFEEIHLSSVVGQHLASLVGNKNTNYIPPNSFPSNASHQTFRQDVIKTSNSTNDLYINDITSMVLEELLLAVENVDEITHKTPFANCHFETSIVRLYRVITSVFCLLKYDDNQKVLLQNIYTRLSAKLNSAPFYNRLLYQVIENLSKVI